MHFPRLATCVVLSASLVVSCQHWPHSTSDPSAIMPAAAEVARNTTPEAPPGLARIRLDGLRRLPGPVEPLAGPPVGDLWDRIRAGFALDHHLEKRRVRAELDWYRRHPAYLDRVATRARRHLFHIVDAVEARQMPLELALLPVVESAFDPFAYSHGRAAGLWQFIPGTARNFGLKIDWWYDGRRDVPAATEAALDYLEHLHDRLKGDWLLALAAYNSGEGNVSHAIRRNRRENRPLDFWSLTLPRETSAYAPRLLAISALIAEPQKYGIELAPIANEPRWEPVDIGSQLDLAKAATLAGVSTEELYLLNPAFNQWSTHPEGPHRLLVPVDKASSFLARLADLAPRERVAWHRHKIAHGESLGLIAQRYHTGLDAIKAANRLRGNVIRAGDSLLIPVAANPEGAYTLSKAGRLGKTREYLESKHGVAPTRYTVKQGDSFWEIARRFGVPMRELAKWNGMATTDILQPDTELLLFIASAPAPGQNEVIRKVNYRVRPGESLSLIADKFNLSVSSIKKWNTKLTGRKYIHPGDPLTLYVDVTAIQ